jgi:hypothetical protein
MTRLRAGNFSMGDATTSDAFSAGRSSISVCIPQMLLSIAPVADDAEALTLVLSRPPVNILRTKRSRSTDGGKVN